MSTFGLGETIFDNRTRKIAVVVAVIPSGQLSMTDVYVLDRYGELYLADETRLSEYDKYYWEEIYPYELDE